MGAPETPDRQQRGMVGGRNLPVAIAVGVALAVAFLASLFGDPTVFAVLVAVLVAVAAVEVGWTLRRAGVQILTGPLVIGTVSCVLATYLLGPPGQALGIALLLVTAFLWLLVDGERRQVTATLGTTAFFGVWLGLFASYAPRLVEQPDGPLVVLAIVGAVILTDIGGYAVGVPFGRHKVAPSISPGKSWEGLVGGLVLAVGVAVLALPVLGGGFTPLAAAVVALAAGSAGFVGDLAESMVKRDLGIKDLGGVLPGHGGVLDRVDGILFALPMGYYGLSLFA